MKTHCTDPEDLRKQWSDFEQRSRAVENWRIEGSTSRSYVPKLVTQTLIHLTYYQNPTYLKQVICVAD